MLFFLSLAKIYLHNVVAKVQKKKSPNPKNLAPTTTTTIKIKKPLRNIMENTKASECIPKCDEGRGSGNGNFLVINHKQKKRGRCPGTPSVSYYNAPSNEYLIDRENDAFDLWNSGEFRRHFSAIKFTLASRHAERINFCIRFQTVISLQWGKIA